MATKDPEARLPQWAIPLVLAFLSVGGSAATTLALTSASASVNAQRIDLLEAKVSDLGDKNADRAREAAVLLERMDAFSTMLVEVRSDVRTLVHENR